MDALWYNYDLSDAKENIKCIKQLERVCRSSLEYDEWQRKCKYKDAKVCPVCNDDYYENNSKCESHHHPKTLFDIVEAILDDHLEKNDLDECTGFKIVEEIMDKHMLGQVQYINLCQHCHKKYHAGHPEVQTKIGLIFLEREKAERAKEVKEEVVEELVIVDTMQVPSNIDIGHTEIEVLQKTSEISEVPSAPKVESLIDAPEILEHRDHTLDKPGILNIETSDAFVSINIDDL